jgi:hypothetical protein
MADIHVVADAHDLEGGHQYIVRVTVLQASAVGPVEVLHSDAVVDVPGSAVPAPSLSVTLS